MPYISFASTLASIILSVLAIILTIVSTSKGDSFIVKIEQTFSKLEGTLEQLNQLPTKTTKNIEDATKRMSELLASAEYFTKKIELLHSKTEELNKNVCKSGEKLNQAIGTQLKDNKEPSYPNGDKFYKLLVTSGSFYGVLAYFICFLAYKYNKDHEQICINKITSKIPEWEEYMVGYLVASSATGMLKIKLIERDAYGITFRVDNFTDKIKEEDIRKSIEIFISSQENTDKEDTKKLIDQIDDYFNPTTI